MDRPGQVNRDEILARNLARGIFASTGSQLVTNKKNAQRGFAIAPILYLLGLIGVGAGILFSGYSQILRSSVQVANNTTTNSDIQSLGTTMAAASVLSSTGMPTLLCPPGGAGASTYCSGTTNWTNVIQGAQAANMPANYSNINSAGSPKEWGVFKAAVGYKQLDPYGHYYMVCRWEQQASDSTDPAILVVSAGPNGTLETTCGSTSAGGDDTMILLTAVQAEQRAAIWQVKPDSHSSSEAVFGQTGSQLVIDSLGNLTVPGTTALSSTLAVTGATTLSSALSGTSAGFSGTITAANFSSTTGSGSFNSLSVGSSGQMTVNSSGNINTSGSLGAGASTLGATTLASNTVTGAETIGSTLGVTGAATLSGALTVRGAETLGSTGQMTIDASGDISTSGTLGAGASTLGATTLASSAVTGNETVGGTETITGVATLNNNLIVKGTNTFGSTGQMTIGATGNVSTSGTFNASGASTFGSTLGVTGQLNGSSAVFSGTVTAASFSGSYGGSIGGGQITGTVAIANGGTGQTTASAALTALGGNNASNLTTGTVAVGLLPTSGVTAGTYNWGTVDTYGRVTAATNVSTSIVTDGSGDTVSAATTNGGTLTFTNASSPAMTINGTNVGIGTSSPGTKLDVNGNIRIENAGVAAGTTTPNQLQLMTGAASERWGITTDGAAESGTAVGSNFALVDYNNSGAALSTPLTINRSTSNATFLGQVSASQFNGSGAGLTGIPASSITGGSGGFGLYFGTSVTANNPQINGQANTGFYTPGASMIAVTNNGNESMRWNASGQIGIGTTSPTSLLHTVDSAAKTAAYTGVLHSVTNTSSTASINKIGMDIESTGAWSGTSAVNTGLVVNATGGTTNYAATFTGGNVGIGTTTPAGTLDVEGGTATAAGANIVFQAQSAPAYNNGGSINLTGGTANGGFGVGGNINITSGASNGGSDSAGNVTIAGGVGAHNTNSNGVGGNVYINGGASAGAPGKVSITAGSATVNGYGATVSITGGNAFYASGNGAGGTITIAGGTGVGTGAGGNIILTPGTGGTAGNVGIGTTSPGTALDLNGAFSVRGMAAPAVSPSGQGRIYFDSTANAFEVSQNGSAYSNLVGSASGGTTNYIPIWTSSTALGSSVIYQSGTSVGIGTTSPGSPLTVSGDISNFASGTYSNIINSSWNNTNWQGPRMAFYRYEGTSASAAVVKSGDTIGWFDYFGYDGANSQRAAEFTVYVDGTPSAGIVPGKFVISTANSSGVNTTRLTAYSNDNIVMATSGGFVGIGTASPGSNLTVVGNSAATSGNTIITNISGAQSVADTGAYYGINLNPTYSAASGNTLATLYGIQTNPQNTSTGTVTTLGGTTDIPQNNSTGAVTTMYGEFAQPQNVAGGTVTTIEGVVGQPYNKAGGAVTTMYGVVGQPVKASTGLVTTMYSLYGQCQNNNATGAVTTCYGLYLDTPVTTGAITNKFGVYQTDSASSNYFAGNVGIGTSSPNSKLEVYGTSAAPSLTANNGVAQIESNSGVALAIGMDPSSPYEVWLQTKRTGNDGTNWSLALNPLGGNVGIGTTAPLSNVDLQGNTNGYVNYSAYNPNAGGSAMAAYYLRNAGSGGPSGGGAYFGLDSGNITWLSSGFNNPMYFQTNAQTRMTILGGGNVGIGLTAPNNILDVNGNIGIASGQSLVFNGYYSSGWKYNGTGYFAGISQSSGNLLFLTAPSGSAGGAVSYTTAMTILNNGNVGIGTASPVTTLDLGTGYLAMGGTGTYQGFNLYYNGGWKYHYADYGYIIRHDGSDLSIQYAPSGSAGATATPVQALTISGTNGTVTIPGNLTVSGTLTAGSMSFSNLTLSGNYLYFAGSTGTVNSTGGVFIYADQNNTVFHMGTGSGGWTYQNNSGSQVIAMTSAGAITMTGNLTMSATTAQIIGGGSSSSYGAITVSGTKNGWGGIDFNSGSGNMATLMVSGDTVGFYNAAVNGWDWYWSGGTLVAGQIPAANINAGTLSGSYTVTGTITDSGETINGTATASGQFISTASGAEFRGVQGNYGWFYYSDGSNYYILLTASGNQYGSYNGLRPFIISLSSGYVSMTNGVGITSGLTVDTETVSGNLTVSAGQLYLPNNSNASTYRLYLAGTDANHYIYSTGSGGNSTYFGEYGGLFHFYDTSISADRMTINGATVTVPGNLTAGTTAQVRALTVLNEMDMAQTGSTGTVYFNVSDTTGSNGSGYTLVIRGLASSGSAQATLSNIQLVASSITAAGSLTAVSFYLSSDARLKHDIQPFDRKGLDIVDGLRAVHFKWNKDNKQDFGVIAQEVEKVLPEAVHVDDKGFRAVQYDKLVVPVIDAVKELHAMLKDLQAKVAKLLTWQTATDARLDAMQKQIDDLTARNHELERRLKK